MALELISDCRSSPSPPPPPPPHLDLYGDLLEAVISRVPTVDLIPASRVSNLWRTAVLLSLRRHPRRFPWLLLRHLRHPSSPVSFLYAFDPFSSSWIPLPPQPQPQPHASASFLRGSSGDRLHTLTVSQILISSDPFGTAWRHEAKAPKVWRQDAVVADLDHWVVVAGGGCPMVLDEGEEVGAVEVFDKHAGTWESAEPMPPAFDGSTSATWLSVATSDKRLYVMEKKTGLVGSFDPKSKRWGPTCQLRPDPSMSMSAWAIAIGRGERLLVMGMDAGCRSGIKVGLWEVDAETMGVAATKLEEEMPREMVDRLFPLEEEEEEEDDNNTWRRQSCSIEACGTERGGYVYNPSEMRNGAVLYEFEVEGGNRIVGRWEWVPVPESVGRSGMGRIEFGCSAVGIDELAPLVH